MKSFAAIALVSAVLSGAPFLTASRAADSEEAVIAPQRLELHVPDPELLNQDGKKVRFSSDVLKNKVVAVNFIFTTCGTICPLMAADFAKLQDLLGDRLEKDFALISVSIDPTTDTPERLKTWSEKFGAKQGWSLLTGAKEEVDALTTALGVSVADKASHAPIVLLGNPASNEWVRMSGFTAPEALRDALVGLTKGTPVSAQAQPEGKGVVANDRGTAFKHYLGGVGDAVLTNQDGASLKLYDDLLKGKTVVVNSFFSSCKSVCPTLMTNLARLQDAAGDRFGKDISFLSITVDPLTDTPEKLKEYANGLKAKPGWQFLTADKETVDEVLAKFGQAVEDKENHYNVFVMGNVPAGAWKKVIGFASPEALKASFQSVLHDEVAAKR